MAIEHPFDKKIEDIFRKVKVEIQVVGMREPIKGLLHVDKGLRLSDHLNNGTGEYLIITDVIFSGCTREVLFIKKEQVITIMPLHEPS